MEAVSEGVFPRESSAIVRGGDYQGAGGAGGYSALRAVSGGAVQYGPGGHETATRDVHRDRVSGGIATGRGSLLGYGLPNLRSSYEPADTGHQMLSAE